MNPEDRKLQHERIKRFALFVSFLFLTLLGRLWYLQIAHGHELLKESELNRERKIRVAAPRGTIYDRKGRILATSRPQFVLTVIPEEFSRDPKALSRLAKILNMTNDELSETLKKNQSLPYAPIKVAIDVPMDIVAKVSERQMLLPGVSVELDQLRFYPDGPAVAHIMGYIGEINKEEMDRTHGQYKPGDYIGKDGLEKQYDSLLHGVDGGRVVEVDAMGRKTRVLRDEAPIPGKSLTLSIDKDVQIAAYRALEGYSGAAVAINPKTGEIIALVSKPDYDPNIFVKRIKSSDWSKIVKNKSLQNRAVANKYPPGSTFKPITGTAALEYGVATTHTAMNCPGSYYIGRHRFGDWKTHGYVDFSKSLAVSCDVYYYEMGKRMGIERLAKMAFGFGLGKPTGIDLPRETSGTVPNQEWKRKYFRVDKEWHPGETVICAIGQGFVEATTLQMSTVAAHVANNGTMMTPHLVTTVRDPKATTKDPKGRIIRRMEPKVRGHVPASLKSLQGVQIGMRETVISGTGKVADVEGIAVAGKTGSAESGRTTAAHGWFICYAPFENPTIAIAVLAEHGRHGATAAAPVARAMLDVYFGKKKPSEISNGPVQASGD